MRVVWLLFSVLWFSLGCLESKLDTGRGGEPEGPGRIEPGPTDPGIEEPSQVESPFENIPPPPERAPNPADPNSDVDCDGIPDWEELELETDPTRRDTDGDGIWDGVEIGRHFSPDPQCADYFPQNLLPPTRRTDPLRKDTDCDGISDGDEDKNKNGRADPGETDPTNRDTDGDGLWDGVELGLTEEMVPDPDPFCIGITRYAQTPRNPTDPLNPDTDGDGIWDGAEDTNKNGRVDPGESDPNNPDDPNRVTEPEVWNACAEENLLPIDIRRNFAAQIVLGLPMGFANSYVDIQNGGTNGLMGVDAARNVAFVAWRHPDTVADMRALRQLASTQADALGGTASVGEFISWDAPSTQPNAVSALFTLSGTRSPAMRANNIAETFLGTGGGQLPSSGTLGDTQHIRAQYVLRDTGDIIVVMAVALDNDFVQGGDGFFGLMDVAGGAALARYFDRTVVQCERSTATHAKVDFLFVVDDSGSMAVSQGQLAAAGTAMAAALNNSTLDWRVALVTSSYHTPGHGNSGIVRGFTNDIQEFQAWLQFSENPCHAVTRTCSGNPAPEPMCGATGFGANSGCWIGVGGNSSEGMLGSARLALMDMSAAATGTRTALRGDAEIVVIVITDTEDHTSGLNASADGGSGINVPSPNWENAANFVGFFQGNTTNNVPGHAGFLLPIRPGVTLPVHAVYCPGWRSGNGCGVPPEYASTVVPTRIQRVVEATGGILTPINNLTAIPNTMAEIVNRAIGGGGVSAQKPLIGASLRVAIRNPSGACGTMPYGSNVPRSRQNGFDYDGFERTVSFFGNCRPAAQSPVAISYRAWETAERLPCENDIHFNPNELDYCEGKFECDIPRGVCACPAAPNACGGCPPRTRCDANACTCVPTLD
ncbi:MAG: adventurous gliding motility lipoprotein CglD [Cystobacterineae bacterium]|nr:adventurous gliding motility lipoprotein CglD [Cystobacterineae bacterium]